MDRITYKKIVFLSLLIFFVYPAYSQVGIYSDTPDISTALDINSPSSSNNKGLLIPQMNTVQKTSIINPAHSLLVYDTDKNCISQNLGSELAPQWTCLTLFNRGFLYMPSINIPTVTLGSSTIDLFAVYKSQFATPEFASEGAPTSVPQFANATDLYYYVTYHNPSRITISGITANGVMSYTTIKKANYDDYINIVFVVK
ncbi:hypothetical protein CLV62_102225 [Dysgonomonas alginatilytica]|uniref:Uncharacterized protein n=1 Tax=Dysgonomonas alginatilytica TaxID=1605892 RepID=A0A2V3PSY5_9BACT|nr:hypothetical protein [Dysgonomonas alginatilytica]PXV68193.1 hypothetical protein CLV62_102225 [Dysgonomonas alginatilytica]